MTNMELQSKTIDFLRFPLAILVVCAHCCLPPIDNLSIIKTVSDQLSEVAVASFFMFSGFLFFNNIKSKTFTNTLYIQKMYGRVKTLLIPYILWNAISIIPYIIMRFLGKTNGGGGASVKSFLNELSKTGINIFWNYIEVPHITILGSNFYSSFPLLGTTWFIRDLMIVSLLTPIIFYFIKYTRFYGLILIGVLYYTKFWFYIPGFSIEAFFFFSLGAYFSIHQKNITLFSLKYYHLFFGISAITFVFILYFNTNQYSLFFFPLFIISTIFSAMVVSAYYVQKGKLMSRFFINSSFFIYMAHVPLLTNGCIWILKNIFPITPLFLVLLYFIGIVLVIFLCLTFYYLLNRFVPNLLNIFMGSRQVTPQNIKVLYGTN